MEPCLKRQVENYKGVVQHRCLNPKSSEHLQVVQPTACSACPVRMIMAAKGCDSTPRPTLVSLPVVEDGYTPCPHRMHIHGKTLCGLSSLETDREICGRCEATVQEETQSYAGKAMQYASAIRMWFVAGRPTRSKEEIERIFRDHCSGCQKYDAENKSCKSCGCAVSTGGRPLTNKIAMGTEHCPLGRW